MNFLLPLWEGDTNDSTILIRFKIHLKNLHDSSTFLFSITKPLIILFPKEDRNDNEEDISI